MFNVKKLKLDKDEIVCVIWKDTQTESCWMDDEDATQFRPSTVRSFGAYGGVVNGGVLIKHNVGEVVSPVTGKQEPEFDGTLIPLGCIVRIKKLKM